MIRRQWMYEAVVSVFVLPNFGRSVFIFIAIPAIRSVPALDLTAVSFCNVPDSDDRARENCAKQPVNISKCEKRGSEGLATAMEDSFISEVVSCASKNFHAEYLSPLISSKYAQFFGNLKNSIPKQKYVLYDQLILSIRCCSKYFVHFFLLLNFHEQLTRLSSFFFHIEHLIEYLYKLNNKHNKQLNMFASPCK